MILHEIPARVIDDEILALINAEGECTDMVYAYAQGAKRALEWIKSRKEKPSDIIAGGYVTLTQQ